MQFLMDTRPLVFDISSDEEDAGGNGSDCGGLDSDCDWISEFFHKNEKEAATDDSDEVVLVSEIVMNPKKDPSLKLSLAKPSEMELDDECVVLDEDPDKLAAVEDNVSGGDSEDLLIVGQKGQIACRDYPHARHLCAKFLFASTPHEQHCHQCHCYVCDSLAPCIHWGSGSSNTDHCHSTDQDPFWRALRKNFKQGDKVLLQLPQPPDSSLLQPRPQAINVPQLRPAQNQIARLSAIRACATSTNSGIPSSTHQHRFHPSLQTSARNRFNPQLVSQQLVSSHNNSLQNVGTRLRPQCPRIFKRQGYAGAPLQTSRPGCISSNNYHASQYDINSLHSAGLSNRSSLHPPHSIKESSSVITAIRTCSLQKSGSNFSGLVPSLPNHVGSLPSQPRALNYPKKSNGFANTAPFRQPTSQTNIGSTFVFPVPSPWSISQPNMNSVQNPVSSQLQLLSQTNMASNFVPPLEASPQPNMGSTFANPVASTQGVSQCNMDHFQSPVPSQSQVLSQPNVAGNLVLSHLEASSQPNMGIRNFGNSVPCDPQPNAGSCSMNPSYPQGAINASFAASNPSWMSVAKPANQTDTLPAQDPVSAYPTVSTSEFDPPASITVQNAIDHYEHCFEIDPWLDTVATDEFGIYCSEAAAVDTGPLFDF